MLNSNSRKTQFLVLGAILFGSVVSCEPKTSTGSRDPLTSVPPSSSEIEVTEELEECIAEKEKQYEGVEFADGKVILAFTEDYTIDSGLETLVDYEASVVERFEFINAVTLSVENGTEIKTICFLEGFRSVRYAEPDLIVSFGT